MFQDIAPHIFHNEFTPRPPRDEDYVFLYQKNAALLQEKNGAAALPTVETVKKEFPEAAEALTYLFTVDGTGIFLSTRAVPERKDFKPAPVFAFRELTPDWMAFAGATAFHLAGWYEARRYCGRCGTMTAPKSDERALVCPKCGLVEYPKISPVVIVAITDGDRLLLTKYAAGYNRYALVAGYAEVGETLEDAVRREVMEEVGLRVKNLRYYESQPWAFSQSLLSGFRAELDGDPEPRIDRKELSEAVWFDRRAIPPGDSTMSLTWTMVEAFRAGEL